MWQQTSPIPDVAAPLGCALPAGTDQGLRAQGSTWLCCLLSQRAAASNVLVGLEQTQKLSLSPGEGWSGSDALSPSAAA